MKISRHNLCLIVILAALLCTALLFISNKHNNTDESNEQTTIRLALWDYDKVSYDRKIIESFEEKYPNIKVEVINYSSFYYNSSIDSLIDGGENVDIIYVNQLDQMYKIIEENFAMPLDDYIEKYKIDLSYYPNLDVLRSEDGELLALPYRKDKFILYYNKNLFNEAGENPPENLTWEGFMHTAEELRASLPENIRPVHTQLSATQLNYIFGGESKDAETLINASPENQLSYLLELESKGLNLPFSTLKNRQVSQMMFETGDYAMYVQGTWYLNILKTDKESGNFDFEWGVESKPVWYEGAEENNSLWMTPVCINKNSSNPDAAWLLMKYICGEEGALILADELVVPAFQNESVRSRMEEMLVQYGIEPSIVLDEYGEPDALLTEEERTQKYHEEEYYIKVLLGLCDIHESI